MSTPTVVKLGGSCLDDLDGAWWDDLAAYGRERPLVLVHGWSKPLKRLRPRYSEPSAVLRDRYGNQSRWTTPEVIEDIRTVSAALAEDVLGRLDRRGITAERLLGSDGLVAAGEAERWWWREKRLVELENLVGPITGVDPAALKNLRPGHAYLVTPLARNAAAGRSTPTRTGPRRPSPGPPARPTWCSSPMSPICWSTANRCARSAPHRPRPSATRGDGRDAQEAAGRR
ncbi:hypothetical protein ACFQ60_06280 [Streptomyces zhihengii]